MPLKRSRRPSVRKAARTSFRTGNSYFVARALRSRAARQSSRRKLVKLVKQVSLRQSEVKRVYVSTGALNLLHNGFQGTFPVLNGCVLRLLGSTYMPTQGSGEPMRVGDEINMVGWKISLVFNQMEDRPNVTFRILCLEVPWNTSETYANWFKVISGNVLLDDPNPDFVLRKRMDKFIRPNQASLLTTGARRYTFCRKMWIPYTKKVRFGPADATTAQTNRPELYFVVMAYDAQNTAQSDKIAEVACYVETVYRDP